MRSLATTCLILYAACFFACNKNSSEFLSNETNKNISVLRSTSEFSTQVQLFNLLSAEEKLQFWKENLNILLSDTTVKKSSEKIRLIKELSSTITSDIFKKGSRAKVIFDTYTSAVWLKSASGVFSKEELYDHFFDHQPIQTNLVGEPNVLADCFCHLGISGYSCKQLSFSVGVPTGVTVTYGICEQANNCGESSWECGLLWAESCNGGHCNFG